jgi:hypothetical protein
MVMVVVVMIYVSAIFGFAIISGALTLVFMPVVFVSMFVSVRVVWIIGLTVLHVTVVLKVFTSARFLTFVDKGTVSAPFPSTLVTLILVLAIGSVPVSWTF